MTTTIKLLDSDSPVMRAALDLHAAGYVPVPIPAGAKKPSGREWNLRRYADDRAVERAFSCLLDGGGVGVLLGSGLVDVDLDSEAARRVAPMLLPRTPVRSGRASSVASHWWYKLADGTALEYRKFKDAAGDSVVELRADAGHQTVLPPSVHPSGEPYEWAGSGQRLADAAEVSGDEIRAAVASVALAAVLVDSWPGEGSRNDSYLALTGALLRGNHDDARMIEHVTKIVRAIAWVTGDKPETRVHETVDQTIKKLAAEGQRVTGWTTLEGLLRGDNAAGVVECAKGAADALRAALGLATALPTEFAGTGGVVVSEEASSWRPVDLTEIVRGLADGTLHRLRPTVGRLDLSDDEDRALFYAGKVNGIAGESGAGKTWTALVVAAQELADGASVLYVDMEDSAAGVVARLLDLGVAPEAVTDLFSYVAPTERLTVPGWEELDALLADVRPSLVVVDSTGEGLALDGANPNADEEVAAWFRRVPRQLADHEAAPAVVVLDHVTKSDDGGLWPIGSQRKRAAINGAQYMQRLVKPFSKERAGAAVLVVAKDRHGHYRTGRRVAQLLVAPERADGAAGADGAVRMDLVFVPDVAPSAGGDSARPTILMERVSRYLETHPGPADRITGRIKKNVKGRAEYITDAMYALVAEGYARTSAGPNNGTVYESVKPYRQDDDLGGAA